MLFAFDRKCLFHNFLGMTFMQHESLQALHVQVIFPTSFLVALCLAPSILATVACDCAVSQLGILPTEDSSLQGLSPRGYTLISFKSLLKCLLLRKAFTGYLNSISQSLLPCFIVLSITTTGYYTLYLFVYCLSTPLECKFHESTDFVCYAHHYMLSAWNRTWDIVLNGLIKVAP